MLRVIQVHAFGSGLRDTSIQEIILIKRLRSNEGLLYIGDKKKLLTAIAIDGTDSDGSEGES